MQYFTFYLNFSQLSNTYKLDNKYIIKVFLVINEFMISYNMLNDKCFIVMIIFYHRHIRKVTCRISWITYIIILATLSN